MTSEADESALRKAALDAAATEDAEVVNGVQTDAKARPVSVRISPSARLVLYSGYLVKAPEFFGTAQKRYFQLSSRMTVVDGSWIFSTRRLGYYEDGEKALQSTRVVKERTTSALSPSGSGVGELKVVDGAKEATLLKGCINLEKARMIYATERLQHGIFEIETSDRTWHLDCLDASEFRTWAGLFSSIGVPIKVERDVDSSTGVTARRMSSFSFDNVRRASRNSIGYLGDMTKKLAASLAAPSTIEDDKEQDSSFKSDGASDDVEGVDGAADARSAPSISTTDRDADLDTDGSSNPASSSHDGAKDTADGIKSNSKAKASDASISSTLLLQQVGKIVKRGSDVGKAVQYMARIHLSKELGYVTVSAESAGTCKGRGTLGAMLCTVQELKQRLFKQIEKRYPEGEEVSPRQRGFSAEQTNQASRLLREGFRCVLSSMRSTVSFQSQHHSHVLTTFQSIRSSTSKF